jgi:hypothetical protein
MSTSPFLPADDPRAGRCGSCGAPLAADQRYCLSCGARREHARLPFQDALLAPTYPAQPGPYAGAAAPPALWSPPQASGPSTATMLAALACVLVAFGVGILVGDDGGQQPLVVGGAAPAAAGAVAPTATTTTDDASASVPEDDAGTEDESSDEKAADTVPDRKLNATEKAEAEEIAKTPAKAPKPVVIDPGKEKDLDSKDPDKAREASQALPDAVSTGD